MLTRMRTQAKPASASAAALRSSRSSVAQSNVPLVEPAIDRDINAERLPKPAVSASFATGSSPEDAANRAADVAIARRPEAEYTPEPVTSIESRPSTAPAQLRGRIESIGGPLPASARKDMEQRFGHDFSRVRVATDREADSLARGLGARAFTHGENIVFAAGKFALETARARRVLAHELAHVVQQREMGCRTDTLQQCAVNRLRQFASSRPQAHAESATIFSGHGLLQRERASRLEMRWYSDPAGSRPQPRQAGC
jgi:uncharacterized protein DUF4157